MRVPVLFSIALCFAVVGICWWLATRKMDFLTPPSDAAIAAIQEQALSTLPAPGQPADAVSAPPGTHRPTPIETPDRPVPSLADQDLTRPPRLDAYREDARHGSGYLVELARLLESHGHTDRASLAWERVIDSSHPEPADFEAAINAIRRLRPSLPLWNPQPEKAIPVILHAGTTASTANTIRPVLDAYARQLEMASSGILKVNVEIAIGLDNLTPQAATPVALWFTGNSPQPQSTEPGALTLTEQSDVHAEVGRTLCKILRCYLTRELGLPDTPTPGDETTLPADAIASQFTRLTWRALGRRLNQSS